MMLEDETASTCRHAARWRVTRDALGAQCHDSIVSVYVPDHLLISCDDTLLIRIYVMY